MNKYKDKLTFSKLEVLCMIVMVLVVVTGGLAIVNFATKMQKVSNLKEEANALINDAKIAYKYYSILENNDYIVSSTDGASKGMCITLDGLVENDFTTKTYDNWDGYIVVEEGVNKDYHYTIWLTNKDYVINGYELSKIEDLKLNEGITKYVDETFTYNVRKKFTGTTPEKGGTGAANGTLKEYGVKCINEKIE